MSFYRYRVFQPNAQGYEPMGNVKRINWIEDFATDSKAVAKTQEWERVHGVKLTCYRFTNIYDSRTYKRLYGEGKLIGA